MKQAKLKSAIKMANLTQLKVAESLNISYNSLSNKMQGNTSFTLDEALAICDMLKVKNPRDVFERREA